MGLDSGKYSLKIYGSIEVPVLVEPSALTLLFRLA